MKRGPKDQTLCPKCGRMYCEGYWGEGVCTADMSFSFDPTARGDTIAEYIRTWYELNRETWWERSRFNSRGRHWLWAADNFILSFMAEVARVQREADRQAKEHP